MREQCLPGPFLGPGYEANQLEDNTTVARPRLVRLIKFK